MRYVVGIDLGGTNIVVGTVAEDGSEVVGLVSVHYAPGPRQWTDEEVAAVEEIVERVVRELASRNEPA